MEGGQQGAETVGPAPDPLQGWGRPNLANLIDFNANSSQNIWISDSYKMDEEQRMMLVESWLSSNGSRPLEQVLGTHWNGTNASGPFLKNGESVGFELDRAMGEDLDVFLSFNQRPSPIRHGPPHGPSKGPPDRVAPERAALCAWPL